MMKKNSERKISLLKLYAYYIFPFEKVKQGSEVILWGYGKVGTQYLEQIKKTGHCRVKYIVDKDYTNKQIRDVSVCAPECIKQEEKPIVIISVKNCHTANGIIETLHEWGIEDKNIIYSVFQAFMHTVEEVVYDEAFFDYYEELKTLFKVQRIKNIKPIRIGREYDGGYVMADCFDKGQVAYSFGIADDISWDVDIMNKGYDVYLYDHTIDTIPSCDRRLHFYKIGLAGSEKHEECLETLDNLIAKNGDESKKNMLLKIDIEGAEWSFIENIDSNLLRRYDQIVFEFHELVTTDNRQRILSCLRKLNNTHQIVHIHANNMSSHMLKWDEEVLPECVEVTYVDKACYEFSNDRSIDCAWSSLDMPNIKGMDEISLNSW